MVLVVGLLLAGYCLLVATKPEWFRNFSLVRRSSDGDYRGSTRLGDLPAGVVRLLYVGVAVVLVVATLSRPSPCRTESATRRERPATAGGPEAGRDRADAAGYLLTVERKSTYTRYRLARDDVWWPAGWPAASAAGSSAPAPEPTGLSGGGI